MKFYLCTAYGDFMEADSPSTSFKVSVKGMGLDQIFG